MMETIVYNVTSSIKSVRVEGENRPGAAAKLTEKLAAAGINLQGFSGAVIGPKFILDIGLDTAEDAAKAEYDRLFKGTASLSNINTHDSFRTGNQGDHRGRDPRASV
jgi:hypothetical protein